MKKNKYDNKENLCKEYNFLKNTDLYKLSTRSDFMFDPYIAVYIASDMDESSENSYHLVQNHIKEKFLSETPERIDGIVDFDGRNAPHKRTKFVEDAHYLCLGCSFTESAGLPNDYSWPSIIRSFTGKSVNNLGLSGVGYKYIASLAMDYMNRLGKPKEILALLPDPERLWIPAPFMRVNGHDKVPTCTAYYQPPLKSYVLAWLDENTCFPEVASHYEKVAKHIGIVDGGVFGNTFSYPDRNGLNILSPEQASFSSLMSLKILENSAKALDIAFKFSTWTDFAKAMDEIGFESFVGGPKDCGLSNEYSDNSNLDIYKRWKTCASSETIKNGYCEHRPMTKNQEKFWHIAIDNNHPGLHDQVHYAEQLLDLKIENDLLKEID